jgi:hypothetical protein
MVVIEWALNEIIVYKVWLLLFFAISLFGAYLFKWKGLLLSHTIVAIIIAFFDYKWIQERMKAPGWDGLPDMDLIFYFGVLARIATVNILSLPFALGIIFTKKAFQNHSTECEYLRG